MPLSVEATGTGTFKVSSMEVSTGAAIGDQVADVELGPIGQSGQGIIDAVFTVGVNDIQGKMVAYRYNDAKTKYAVCGFSTGEEEARSFFIIEQ
jgi:hypothetical protein